MSDEQRPRTIIALGPAIPYLQALLVVIAVAIAQSALDSLLAWIPTLAQIPGPVRASLAAGVLAAIAYLKKSPLTREEWTPEERAAERAKLESQGRLPK